MGNTIYIGEVPDYKASFLVGVLVGMEIPYKIDPKSPMYRVLDEHKREIYIEGQEARGRKDKIPYNNMGYRVIHESGDSDAVTVKIKDM